MATQYPNGVDNTSSLPYVTNGVSPMVGEDVNRLRDAVVAVETELGANPSGTFTSVGARLGAAETAISDYANSTFLVLSTDGFISQERVLAPSVNFAVVDGGAGANYGIDLAANVGIGTLTPASDYSLTLDGNGTTRIGGVTLRNAGTDTFYIGSATVSDSANISLMNPNAGYLVLGTDGTERVRVTSAGDIGLGTTSPAGRLHVSGGDLLVDTGDVGIGTLTPSERLHVSGGNLLLESTAGAGLPYATMKGTQGGFRMSSGNGIGKLDVLNSTGTVIMSLLNNVDNRLVGANNADFSFYTNNAEKMRITAGGDLLVNSTANPDLARLHISGGGITHSSNQFNARPGAGVNYEWVNRNGAGHTWYVNSAATQAMTLTSAGNFGIGTSLPVSQFSVGSSSEFRVDSSGDITRINDVPYTFPASQGVASSVLKNDGSGSLDWSLLADTEIVGGLQTVADTTARDAIPSGRRKEGMLAYSQADDRYFVLEGGLTNPNWKEFGDDNRLVGGLQTVADTTARDAIPVAKRKEGMIVYSQADDRHFVLEGGTANVNWLELGDDNRLVGGLQTVASVAARNAIPAAKLKEGMVVYAQDVDRHFVREGGVWVEMGDDSRLVGGFRVVSSLTTIPLANQKVDMVVMLSTDNSLYRLNVAAAPPIPAGNWRKLFTASGVSGSVSGISIDQLTLSTNGIISADGGQLGRTDISHLQHIKGRPSGTAEGASRVYYGLQLLPSTINVGGDDYAPAATLKAGSGVSAIGYASTRAADTAATNLNLAANYIGGVAPPTFPANVYAFVNYDGDFKFSATAPDASGRPATADVGYAVDDYVYVGFLRPKLGVFDNTGGPEYDGIWGGFEVSHQGNGVRTVFVNNESALGGGTGASPANTVPNGTVTVSVGPSNPHTLFPTAFEMELAIELAIRPVTGQPLGVYVMDFASKILRNVFAPGRVLGNIIAGPLTSAGNTRISVRRPTYDAVKPEIELTNNAASAGNAQMFAHAQVSAVVENVNAPVPSRQAVFPA